MAPAPLIKKNTTMKKKLIISVILSFAVITALIPTILRRREGFFAHAGSSELWRHYSGVAPTLTEKGTKEYWVSCSTSKHVFEAPQGATIQDGPALNRSFVNGLSNDDDRLVPSYTEIMGFEDGNVPSYVTPKLNISSLSIVNDGTEGSKCLKITVSGSDYGVYFAKEYLDAVFSDPNVVAINFDAKGSIASSNFRAKINGYNTTYELNNSNYGLTTSWKKFSYTREYYNAYAAGDAMIYGGGLTSGNYVLVDNILPVTENLTSFGFENGFYNASSKIYMSAGHSNSEPASEQILKLLPSSGVELTNIGFDYNDKTEGNRSFVFDKTNGYVAIYLSTAIKSSLGENAYVKFDFKTTVTINSNPSVKNATDGMNQPFGGAGYQLKANEWITLNILASDCVSADGRFLILQGSTAGTIHIDNIRFDYYEQTQNTSILNRNIYLDNTDGSTLFQTKRTPLGVSEIEVDGALISNSNVSSVNSSGISLNNSYLSTLSNGDHKIIISYYYTHNHIVSETYYQNVYFGTLKSAVSVSTSYGSADYYTLPDTYTDLYRIVANGMDIPFERLNGGNTYSVPNASLIEALPTVNGSKSTGSITLFIFTISELFRLPVTVNLTTAAVKSYTQYNDGQIPAFYYSSTQHGYDTTNEYQDYLSLDKLNEYYNGGNEIIYEQYLHVGANHTSLTTQIKYLLDNANILGKKVIVADDAFTLLARSTVSLIGNDVTVGSATLHFYNTTDLDNYVTSRLNLYINHPACYGVNVGDEESYTQLINGYSDLMHSIHRCLTSLNREDFYINSNLQPMSATTEVTTGNSTGSGNIETDYRTYLNAYVQASGNDYISYDYYPLGNGNSFSKEGIGPYVLRNLLIVAQVAKENNLKVHVITQTYSFGHSSNTLILNSEDVSYLSNMLMAFGVKQICYFTFYHRGAATGSESWNENGCVMTADGVRNDLYYYMQAQRAQISEMGPVLGNFNFEWFYIYRASTSSNRIINPTAYSYLYSNRPYSSTSYQKLKGVASPSKSWTSVTGLYNAVTGEYMYTVQNLHRKPDQSSISQTVNLNFDSSINYFAIYENGSVRIVDATTYNSYKRLTLTLSSGHTAFIMAY